MTLDQKASPVVSVIIPTYNVAGCLTRAVDSVLAQSFQDFEIIIIDDASTDNTVEIAARLAELDTRVRVFPQNLNQGPSVARNLGLDAARGEWAAVLDADDAFTETRLASLLSFAEGRSYDVVADNLILYDEGVKKHVGSAFDWPRVHQLTIDLLLKRDVYMRGTPLGWIKPMYNLNFLRRNNLRYPPNYRHAEDFYLLASLLLSRAKFWLTPEAGYIYTLRMGSLSRKASPFSASVPNMDSVAASCDELIERFNSHLTSEQVVKLKRRKKRFLDGTEVDVILKHARERRRVRALLAALSRPRAAAMILERAVLGVVSRIKQR
ncbi:glycosyltransferase family 2 protein [Stenotrophomonas sp. CFBP 13718]|uniref:glycosyltransferase family 2 protein n=1 Tax=Stenotrophomonas sp. CFBP 13718 TaxID=2775304 RepID=UPI00177CA461|nr:glycosyltransferase family 2 protein [Stenotrophomonas sp. CFBP 13718]MBD8696063.1 glycosyltransferase family 2 protein [Stenotrophomonas sp. CFBP 13718]